MNYPHLCCRTQLTEILQNNPRISNFNKKSPDIKTCSGEESHMTRSRQSPRCPTGPSSQVSRQIPRIWQTQILVRESRWEECTHCFGPFCGASRSPPHTVAHLRGNVPRGKCEMSAIDHSENCLVLALHTKIGHCLFALPGGTAEVAERSFVVCQLTKCLAGKGS